MDGIQKDSQRKLIWQTQTSTALLQTLIAPMPLPHGTTGPGQAAGAGQVHAAPEVMLPPWPTRQPDPFETPEEMWLRDRVQWRDRETRPQHSPCAQYSGALRARWVLLWHSGRVLMGGGIPTHGTHGTHATRPHPLASNTGCLSLKGHQSAGISRTIGERVTLH